MLLVYSVAAFHIRAQQWSDAVMLLTRFASACDTANLRSSQCRAYLSAVVVLLYAQDTLQAFNVYQVRSEQGSTVPSRIRGHSPFSILSLRGACSLLLGNFVHYGLEISCNAGRWPMSLVHQQRQPPRRFEGAVRP